MTIEAFNTDSVPYPPDLTGSRLKIVPNVGALASKEAGSITPDDTDTSNLSLYRSLRMPLPFFMTSHQFEEWIIYGELPSSNTVQEKIEPQLTPRFEMLVFPLASDYVLGA